MKVSLHWLNEYLDRPAAAEEVERLLAEQGFPIESVTPLPGGDVLIDAEITSNRGDCLCYVGIAREVAAGSGRSLRLPAIAPPVPGATAGTRVEVQAPNACPLYTARVIQGVKIAPSPDWLVKRLESIGLRSVNNVVDVTNFVLHEMGQPLHAFDLSKLAERRVVVRMAQKDEPFTAIDGSRHRLRPDMLVIADAAKPVALAGVMGGLDSEVSLNTTDVLLESARFDPLTIRTAARVLKLASDSSYRFERGVDPRNVELASRRAAAMLVELAGGVLLPGVVRVGEDEPEPKPVSMRLARCRDLLGIDISPETIVDVLSRLGLSPTLTGNEVRCLVPTFRGRDVEREVDLIEEVARLHGLQHVPVQEKIHIVARSVQPHVAARQRIGQVLTAHGFFEAVTFSFIAPRNGQPFLTGDPVLIDDERRKTEPMLRPSLLPSLLQARKFNQDVGNHEVALFETASVWRKECVGICETRKLALLRDARDASAALRDLRGCVEELVHTLTGLSGSFQVATHGAMSAAATVALRDRTLGVMGLLGPATQHLFDLQTPAVVAELDLDPLLALYPPARRVRPLPGVPGIERDLSVILDEAVRWEAVEREVRQANPALLEELRFVTVYRGKPVPAGRKSLTLRMHFRHAQKTLRHDEVDPQVAAVVDRLKTQLHAELRV